MYSEAFRGGKSLNAGARFRLHVADRILRGRCKHYPKGHRLNSGAKRRKELVHAKNLHENLHEKANSVHALV